MRKCAICKSDSGIFHEVKEMMFGFRDVFRYFECSTCGCLQLVNPPADMGRYYPSDRYYSYYRSEAETTDPRVQGLRPIQSARRWFALRQREALLFERNGIFRQLARRHNMDDWAGLIRKYLVDSPRPSFEARILDVGCGNGSLLSTMAAYGLSHLEGVDAFIEEDIVKAGYRVRKCDVMNLDNEIYDVVLMNHSLEHMPDQFGTLKAIRGLLAPRGVCRIEIPVAGCEAWEAYGTDWAEIDAPRHYFLHTRRSMEILARETGLEICRYEYVGSAVEFRVSELYRRGLPQFEPGEKSPRLPSSVFGESELVNFERRAAEANRSERGGRMMFLLRRADAKRAG